MIFAWGAMSSLKKQHSPAGPERGEQADPKQYPRTYSMDARTRRANEAIGLAPLALIIAVTLLDAAGLVDKAVTPLALLTMLFLAGLCALIVSRWTRRRVILYEDGIELLGVFANRKLKRSEILGRRMGGPIRETLTAGLTT